MSLQYKRVYTRILKLQLYNFPTYCCKRTYIHKNIYFWYYYMYTDTYILYAVINIYIVLYFKYYYFKYYRTFFIHILCVV